MYAKYVSQLFLLPLSCFAILAGQPDGRSRKHGEMAQSSTASAASADAAKGLCFVVTVFLVLQNHVTTCFFKLGPVAGMRPKAKPKADPGKPSYAEVAKKSAPGGDQRQPGEDGRQPGGAGRHRRSKR